MLGVGLVKVYKELIRLVSGGTLPFWHLCQKLSLSLFDFNKTAAQKLLSDQAWSPGPKWTMDIMNLTPFTISYYKVMVPDNWDAF